jgi:hypothetical protein
MHTRTQNVARAASLLLVALWAAPAGAGAVGDHVSGCPCNAGLPGGPQVVAAGETIGAPQPADAGFDYDAAGIGAAVTAASALAGLGVGIGLRRRHRAHRLGELT